MMFTEIDLAPSYGELICPVLGLLVPPFVVLVMEGRRCFPVNLSSGELVTLYQV